MVATYGSNYFIFWGISAFHTFLIRCGSRVEIFILHCVQLAGQPDQKQGQASTTPTATLTQAHYRLETSFPI